MANASFASILNAEGKLYESIDVGAILAHEAFSETLRHNVTFQSSKQGFFTFDPRHDCGVGITGRRNISERLARKLGKRARIRKFASEFLEEFVKNIGFGLNDFYFQCIQYVAGREANFGTLIFSQVALPYFVVSHQRETKEPQQLLLHATPVPTKNCE